MTAAVYVVGGPGDREDLRFSIRSLTLAPVIDAVWVVGDVPDWFTGRSLRLMPHPEKFTNQRRSITKFVDRPDAPERFYLFNDDMFITEPVDGELPVCRSQHRAEAWLEDERRTRSLHHWHDAVMATARWVGGNPWIYETHTPLLFDTARLRAVLDEIPRQPFAVGEIYPVAGAGGPGRWCGNAKVKRDDPLDVKLAQPMPYLSTNPETWDGTAGDYLRRLFPDPSIYESMRPATVVEAL